MSLGFTFKFEDEPGSGGSGSGGSGGANTSTPGGETAEEREARRGKAVTNAKSEAKSARDEEREIERLRKEQAKKYDDDQTARGDAIRSLAGLASQMPVIGPAITKGMMVFDKVGDAVNAIKTLTGDASRAAIQATTNAAGSAARAGGFAITNTGSAISGAAKAVGSAVAGGGGQAATTAVAAGQGGGSAITAATGAGAGGSAILAIGPVAAIAGPIAAVAASATLAAGAVYAYAKVHQTAFESMKETTQRLSQVNGAIAAMQAEADVNKLMIDMRSGRRLEDELRRFAPARNQTEDAIARLSDTISEALFRQTLPALEKAAAAIEGAAVIAEKSQPFVESQLKMTGLLIDKVTPIGGILDFFKFFSDKQDAKESEKQVLAKLLTAPERLKPGDVGRVPPILGRFEIDPVGFGRQVW